MAQWQNHCFVYSSLDSIPDKVEIFYLRFLHGTKREGGTESESLVSVPNIPGLNPKSLCSPCDMKVYVQFLVIHLSDGEVKPDALLAAFWKE